MTKQKPKAEETIHENPVTWAEEPTQEQAPQAPQAPQQRLVTSPDVIAQIFQRKTQISGALVDKPLIARRRYEFQLDGSVCAPDVFVDENGDYFDIMVTVQSLTSAEEIEALGTAAGDPARAPYALAKRALCALNGHEIDAHQRDFFWEALGMGGRQLVFLAFGQIGSASMGALGKFRATFSPC